MTDLSSRGLYIAVMCEKAAAAGKKDRTPALLGPIEAQGVDEALAKIQARIEEFRSRSDLPADKELVRYDKVPGKFRGEAPHLIVTALREGGPRLEISLHAVDEMPTHFNPAEVVLRLRRGTPPELRPRPEQRLSHP